MVATLLTTIREVRRQTLPTFYEEVSAIATLKLTLRDLVASVP